MIISVKSAITYTFKRSVQCYIMAAHIQIAYKHYLCPFSIGSALNKAGQHIRIAYINLTVIGNRSYRSITVSAPFIAWQHCYTCRTSVQIYRTVGKHFITPCIGIEIYYMRQTRSLSFTEFRMILQYQFIIIGRTHADAILIVRLCLWCIVTHYITIIQCNRIVTYILHRCYIITIVVIQHNRSKLFRRTGETVTPYQLGILHIKS